MGDFNQLNKPIRRGKVRRFLGKKFFIAKRKIEWLKCKRCFATQIQSNYLEHKVFEHSSTLLRPLKDVDMQYQHNKITNLRLAIDYIDGVLIQPGETFSLWYLVGNPSKERGFLKGLVLSNGQIGYDYGGGLCQLGNLLYWMVLHSSLTVTERWRHGFDVFPDINRKLPFGSGATLSYNYIDLQFKNETDKVFQIHLFLTEERLHGELLSNYTSLNRYEVYEAEHAIKHEYWGGYTRHNRLNRKVFEKNSGKEMSDDLITENHAIMMYDPLLSDGR